MAHRAGFVAIVGRPNVGKSTLLNALIGARVAAVSPKPQTTRNRIVGIRTLPEAQVVFLDTPGIHAARSALNRRLVATAEQALGEADVLVLVVDAAAGVLPADRELATILAGTAGSARDRVPSGPRGRPVIVALNKRDRVRPSRLLPMLAELGTVLPGRDLIPVSARTGEGVEALLASVAAALPEGPRLHPEDDFTTESERFIAQEMVREQLFRQTEEEVPYGTAVEIEEFRDDREKRLVFIRAVIVVERETHKGIVIGAKGARLKEVGTRARLALESLLGTKVFLELFVRVEPGWTGNPRRMKELGL